MLYKLAHCNFNFSISTTSIFTINAQLSTDILTPHNGLLITV